MRRKGTTDFSVLKVTNGPGGKDVSRLARSGIVGAGNVMTFAVFASVLQSILKVNGIKNSLIKDTVSKVLFGNGNVDRAHKNALYLLVEQLKQMPISNTRKDIDSFLNDYYKGKPLEKTDDLDIEYVNEIIEKLLKNHCYIKDNDLMGKYANAISSTLIEELRNIYNEHVDIDEVIFSGRGSLCDILRRSIYEELRKNNPKLIDPDIHQELTPKRLKMNCLYGPLTRDMFYDRENINIIGWPLLRRKSERISVTKHKHQKKNKGIFATKPGMEDETKGLYSRERTNKEGIGLLANFQGESVQLGDADCYFSLGNRNYTIDNQIHKDLYGSDLSVQIFFDGEDFVLRTKDDIFRLTPRGDDKDYSLLYETLFPMTEGNADLQYKKGFKTLQESTEANSNENDPNTTAQNKIIQDFLKNI